MTYLPLVLSATAYFGYYAGGILSSVMGVPSTPISVGVRVIVLVLAALSLIRAHSFTFVGGGRAAFQALIIFFIYYGIRIVLYSLDGQQLLYPLDYYFTWAFGVSLLPLAAMALSHNKLSPRAFFSAYILLYATIGVLVALTGSVYFFDSDTQSVISHGRLTLTALNPITIGMIGGSIVTCCAWVVVAGHFRGGKVFGAFLIAMLFLGAYLLYASGSRGPLLALMGTVGFMLIWQRRINLSLVLIVVIALSLTGFILFRILEGSGDLAMFGRINAALDGTDAATLTRQLSYLGAWETFLQHPLFGGAMEEPYTNFYPHNIFLEALMANGLVGASPFFFGVVLIVFQAGKMIRQGSHWGWVGCLVIFELGNAAMAGALYAPGSLWTVVGLFFLALATELREPRRTSVSLYRSLYR